MDFLHWEGPWTALQPVVGAVLFASLFFGVIFSADVYPPAPMAVFMVLVPVYLYQVSELLEVAGETHRPYIVLPVEALDVPSMEFIEIPAHISPCTSGYCCSAAIAMDHLGVFNRDVRVVTQARQLTRSSPV